MNDPTWSHSAVDPVPLQKPVGTMISSALMKYRVLNSVKAFSG